MEKEVDSFKNKVLSAKKTKNKNLKLHYREKIRKKCDVSDRNEPKM